MTTPEDVRERMARTIKDFPSDILFGVTLLFERLADEQQASTSAEKASAMFDGICALILSEREKAAEEERERAETVRAQAYQVIGNLLDRIPEAFNSPEGIRALDYFSGNDTSEDFLPWPARGQSLHDSDYVPIAAAIRESKPEEQVP